MNSSINWMNGVEMKDVKPGDLITITKIDSIAGGIVRTVRKLSEGSDSYCVRFEGNPFQYLVGGRDGFTLTSAYHMFGHASEEGPQAAEPDSTPDMIRITDLHDLREGDTVHFHHGTWKSVGVVDAVRTSESYNGKRVNMRFHDIPSYIGEFIFAYKPEDTVATDCVFDYAERRAYDSWSANDLPDEPGFYRAATGSVWKFDGEVFSPVFDHDGELVPYKPFTEFTKRAFLKPSIKAERFPFIRVTLTVGKWSPDYKDNGQYSPDADDASEADF